MDKIKSENKVSQNVLPNTYVPDHKISPETDVNNWCEDDDNDDDWERIEI